ncbi:calcium homeostasis modulator protein 2-like isoform X2 [Heterodontus francisci]|uniref:calcium homeostasis modulator protein 2-like isoform X2 n=1 Tax=Heterodontus francisci TaxID=7792 RepID=UPI00355B47F0
MAVDQLLNQLKGFFLNKKSATFKAIENGVVFLILYGLEELMERNIPCPCVLVQNSVYALLFFLFPSVILFLISLLLQFDSYQWHWCKESCKCSITCTSLPIILFCKAAIPPALWIFILFLDGDYYACAEMMEGGKANRTTCAEFSCQKQPINLLSDLHRHCYTSQLIGSILFFVFLVFIISLHCLRHCTCMEKYYYKIEYDSMRGEEENEQIMEKLKTEAGKQVKTKPVGRIEDLLKIILPNYTRQQNIDSEGNETDSAEADDFFTAGYGFQNKTSV